MPTFRASVQSSLSESRCDTESGLPLFENEVDVDELNQKLASMNIGVLLKVHHLQAGKSMFQRKYSNIVIVEDEELQEKGLQLYEVIGYSDALITDYSSVYIDYLIANKPEAFILADIEQYEQDRGFCWDDVRQIMPGFHIYSKNDFFSFVQTIAEGKDEYVYERNRLLPLFHNSADGTSCQKFDLFFGL